jgi:hypothetical protein
MGPEPDRYARGQEIRDRLDAIRDRLAALARARAADRDSIPPAGSAARAQEAQDTAAYAAVSLTRALYWAAQAHEHAARMHDKAAATGPGNPAGHHRQAAFHRDAAEADRLRAAGLPAARMPGLAMNDMRSPG